MVPERNERWDLLHQPFTDNMNTRYVYRHSLNELCTVLDLSRHSESRTSDGKTCSSSTLGGDMWVNISGNVCIGQHRCVTLLNIFVPGSYASMEDVDISKTDTFTCTSVVQLQSACGNNMFLKCHVNIVTRQS